MTRQELRVWMDSVDLLCGCGNPPAALMALRRLLDLHDPGYRHIDEMGEWIADEGLRYLLLYRLEGMGLTEHGRVIDGGWLTEQGRRVLAALAAESDDQFEALLDDHCIHGIDASASCAACQTWPA